jgi:hypothetical protein
VHAEQLARYAGYIEQMGYSNVRRAVVYLEEGAKVVVV